MRTTSWALPLGMILLTASGCSSLEESTESSESDLIGRRSGASINSPNVNPSATYLSVRRIDTLEEVGALRGPLVNLAARVDGIIANQPPDGRISITEILQLEQPGFIQTLFPTEQVMLPELWKLLETTNAALTNVSLPPLVTLGVADISTAAGTPIEPAKLDIATLPQNLRLSAERLELTQDSDGDPTTVTKADLAAAIATPGPYTPAEISDFTKIQLLFSERAGTSLAARVQVTAPTSTSTTLATWGSASLGFVQSLDYSERRARYAGDGALSVILEAHLVESAVVRGAENAKVVLIDETSEKEAILRGPLESAGGATTVEIWSNGARVGSWRATLPALVSVDNRTDLSVYAEHTFVTPNGTTLARNVVNAATTHSNVVGQSGMYSGSFVFETTAKPAPAGVDSNTLGFIATPSFDVAPGRYEIDVAPVGKLTFDLYPEGVIKMSRPGGATTTASLYVWRNTKFSASFPDGLRAIYDPATNTMTIFLDERPRLFEGPLTGAMRAG